MRLICPNCGAQYQVPDDAIPPGGRDVQCSNCAHTWLEKPGASEAAEAGDSFNAPAPDNAPEQPADPDERSDIAAGEPGHAPDDTGDAGGTDDTGDDDTQDSAPSASSTDETMSAIASLVAGSTPAAEEPEAAARKTPARQALSPGVSEILREEAARERAARMGEATADALGDSQPDLDLDRPVDREEQLAEEARRRMARLKGEPSAPISAPVTQTSGARSELLPDIEEISSSLRSSDDAATGGDAEPEPEIEQRRQKRGFRFGFSIIVLIFALLALIYVFAPQISAAVPALEPTVDAYVETVDQGRLWLDMKMQSILDSAEAGPDAAVAPATPEAAPESAPESAPETGIVTETPQAPAEPATE